MMKTTIEASNGRSVTIGIERIGHDYGLEIGGQTLEIFDSEAGEDVTDATLAMQRAVLIVSTAMKALGLLDPQPACGVMKIGSDSNPGAYYAVSRVDDEYTCTCPSFTHRGVPCKHIARARTLGL